VTKRGPRYVQAPKLGKRAVIDGAHHREGWRRPASGAVVGPPSEANRRGV